MTTSVYGRWEPGIGDPTVIGWVTVVAYGVATLLCFSCQRPADATPHRRFWTLIAVTMLLLGVNKQLDLQTWFTETGRDLAIEYGWHQHRRPVQIVFIAWLALAAVVGYGALRVRMKALDVYAHRASLGLLLLAVFVVVRAVSFHHVDKLLGLRVDSVSMNAFLELGGIGLVVLAAWARRRAVTKSPDN